MGARSVFTSLGSLPLFSRVLSCRVLLLSYPKFPYIPLARLSSAPVSSPPALPPPCSHSCLSRSSNASRAAAKTVGGASPVVGRGSPSAGPVKGRGASGALYSDAVAAAAASFGAQAFQFAIMCVRPTPIACVSLSVRVTKRTPYLSSPV